MTVVYLKTQFQVRLLCIPLSGRVRVMDGVIEIWPHNPHS